MSVYVYTLIEHSCSVDSKYYFGLHYDIVTILLQVLLVYYQVDHTALSLVKFVKVMT